ncbi:hypothetical protein MVG78_01040 [Roseomonas gilardii subsp. gilardii]|uniref:hypothetical protein n=1 Tax=Roseomonas gilardii TaxID=257708 RepID=UPI001FFABCC9|nr:hypothetical protein [Roseomonas gilardii]UPG72820.1 hypothetical protein MVG78_01040 [Roseomonas gilardii subsp. gilardii]
MAGNTDFLASAETMLEVAKFFHELSHRSDEGQLPDKDARRQAGSLGLLVPASLGQAPIQLLEADKATGTTDAGNGNWQITIRLPPEKLPAGRTAPPSPKCYQTCKSGPFGLGKVCFKICVSCTFKRTSVSCEVTIGTTVSI